MQRAQHTIWAMAFLEPQSEKMLRKFFVDQCGVKQRLVVRDMHCTVYHARRPIAGIANREEPLDIWIPGPELRMMTLTPGGENLRPEIDATKSAIGVRIRRASGASDLLENLRNRFVSLETSLVLGNRLPSNRLRSAFGASHYQPHIAVLRAKSLSDPDLSKIGSLLRNHVDGIKFDRLVVRYRSN